MWEGEGLGGRSFILKYFSLYFEICLSMILVKKTSSFIVIVRKLYLEIKFKTQVTENLTPLPKRKGRGRKKSERIHRSGVQGNTDAYLQLPSLNSFAVQNEQTLGGLEFAVDDLNHYRNQLTRREAHLQIQQTCYFAYHSRVICHHTLQPDPNCRMPSSPMNLHKPGLAKTI